MPEKTNPWLYDEKFLEVTKECAGIHNFEYDINANSFARMHILRQLAKDNNSANFAEAGIYAGMSVFYVAEFCNKDFIAIDSFKGLSKPGEHDTDYFKEFDLAVDKSYAEKTLAKYKNVKIYDGWIPEILNHLPELEYSYVNIDVDLYEPTKNSIEYFWNRLVRGGVMILDDFGSQKTLGAKKAALELLPTQKKLELDTGQCIVYKD